MSNPCKCCKSKVKFVSQMHDNFKDSMVIPEWLVNHFGVKISGTIKLEDINGQIHDVGVAKEMNRTVLQSGWEAFVDVNQIQENFSLMFRLIGISCFKVTIFDANGEERNSCCAGMKNPTHVEKPSTNCTDISSNSHDGTAQSSDSNGHFREQGKKPAVESSCDEFSDDSPSESESMELDDLWLSKDYVLSGRCYLTEEQCVCRQNSTRNPFACGNHEEDQCEPLPYAGLCTCILSTQKSIRHTQAASEEQVLAMQILHQT